jgi:hypothetical protein
MAPPAFEWATFKKDCRADSWTIMDGITLDIKNHSSYHGYS